MSKIPNQLPPTPPPDAPREGRDPALWPAETLAALQAVLDRSLKAGGAAVLDTFDHPDRRLSAAQFVTWWNETRLKAMSTVGPGGVPHIAPVHAEFVDGRLRTTIYEHAVRRRDLHANPEVAFTTWADHGAAAIVNGRAREIPDSSRETRPGATGRARRTVTLEIEVTRIYAMKPRAMA